MDSINDVYVGVFPFFGILITDEVGKYVPLLHVLWSW